MKTSLKEILESIPDFEDFMKLASEIGELSFKKMRLEVEIKSKESKVFRDAMKMPLENGKLPSASFVVNAYMQDGLNGELIQYRESLADYTAQLEKRKLQYSIYKEMIGLFQTVSANERNQGF